MIELFVVLKHNTDRYYLLKVVRHGFDVYCIPPHLGVHHSLHTSGESHFRHEERAKKPTKPPPVSLVMGEAGTPTGEGIARASLANLGRASGICTALCPIGAPSRNFCRFNRSAAECFEIDARLFPKHATVVEVGVWAVPARNKAGFEFNHPDIPSALLYKAADCEPQIWIYARPI